MAYPLSLVAVTTKQHMPPQLRPNFRVSLGYNEHKFLQNTQPPLPRSKCGLSDNVAALSLTATAFTTRCLQLCAIKVRFRENTKKTGMFHSPNDNPKQIGKCWTIPENFGLFQLPTGEASVCKLHPARRYDGRAVCCKFTVYCPGLANFCILTSMKLTFCFVVSKYSHYQVRCGLCYTENAAACKKIFWKEYFQKKDLFI